MTSNPLHHIQATLFHRAIIFVCLLISGIAAQQKPFADVQKFQDEEVFYRTNVCDRQRQLYQNNLGIANALKGLNLTVAMTHYTKPYEDDFFNLDSEGRIPQEKPGLFVVIMDELSRRAGFQWRDSFVALEPVDPATDNRTWSDMLEWSVNVFDISVDNWAKTVKRMRRSVAFPEGWYDSSLILVERVNTDAEDVDMWSFLTPFQPPVWIMICVAAIATGVVYWVLERLNKNSDEGKMEDKPLTTIFLSALTFTGNFDFHPNTHAARILSFSWTFWALIVVSAYTANLASFLVARRVPQFSIETIEQAVRYQVPVCVQASTNQDELLTEMFPEIQLVRKRFDSEVFKGVKSGECRVAVTPVNTYEVYVRTTTINNDCSLKSDKRVIEILSAGLATAIDSGSNCTSLIDNVIDLHMTQMKADGFIEQVWNSHLRKVGDQSCLAQESSMPEQKLRGGDDGETESLTLEEMAGIFILHGILTTLALSFALVRFFLVKKEDPQVMLEKLGLAGEETATQEQTQSQDQSTTQFQNQTDSIAAPNQYWDP